MNFDKIYSDAKKEKKQEFDKKKKAVEFNNREAIKLYSEMNYIVFSKLDYTPENSTVSTDNDTLLKAYYNSKNDKIKYNLDTIADDFSIITMHVKLDDLISPFMIAKDYNSSVLCRFIQLYDSINDDNLAKILCEDSDVKSGNFRYTFNLHDFIIEHDVIQKECAENTHYLAGFEISKNDSLSKKTKSIVYDFKFCVITNLLKDDNSQGKKESVENITPPNCKSHVKPNFKSGDMKIIEINSPEEFEKILSDIFKLI